MLQALQTKLHKFSSFDETFCQYLVYYGEDSKDHTGIFENYFYTIHAAQF